MYYNTNGVNGALTDALAARGATSQAVSFRGGFRKATSPAPETKPDFFSRLTSDPVESAFGIADRSAGLLDRLGINVGDLIGGRQREYYPQPYPQAGGGYLVPVLIAGVVVLVLVFALKK